MSSVANLNTEPVGLVTLMKGQRSKITDFFDIGQSLLVDFGLCSPTRLVFLTLVSRCWWTLACTLPLVLSF